MRVALHKGRIIEAQSGDGASLDALRKNAIAAGFTEADCQFLVMKDDEVAKRIKEQNDAIPAPKSRMDLLEERVAALEKRR